GVAVCACEGRRHGCRAPRRRGDREEVDAPRRHHRARARKSDGARDRGWTQFGFRCAWRRLRRVQAVLRAGAPAYLCRGRAADDQLAIAALPVCGNGPFLFATLLLFALANTADGVAEFVLADRLLRVHLNVVVHEGAATRIHRRLPAANLQRQRCENRVRYRELAETNTGGIPAPFLSVGCCFRPIARRATRMIRCVFCGVEVDAERRHHRRISLLRRRARCRSLRCAGQRNPRIRSTRLDTRADARWSAASAAWLP